MENQVYLSMSSALNFAHIPCHWGKTGGGAAYECQQCLHHPSFQQRQPPGRKDKQAGDGMPIININRPKETDIPVTVQVK